MGANGDQSRSLPAGKPIVVDVAASSRAVSSVSRASTGLSSVVGWSVTMVYPLVAGSGIAPGGQYVVESLQLNPDVTSLRVGQLGKVTTPVPPGQAHCRPGVQGVAGPDTKRAELLWLAPVQQQPGAVHQQRKAGAHDVVASWRLALPCPREVRQVHRGDADTIVPGMLGHLVRPVGQLGTRVKGPRPPVPLRDADLLPQQPGQV